MKLVFALLLAGRVFHPESVDSVRWSRHTHVTITGPVTLVRNEEDGDIHFRVSDPHGHFVVCEIVPYHVLPAPTKGQVVTVNGIRRYDNEVGHGWWEVHPVESWELVK